MAKVRLLHGRPLMVGGKVALADACCCEHPPTGCPTVTFSGLDFNCPCTCFTFINMFGFCDGVESGYYSAPETLNDVAYITTSLGLPGLNCGACGNFDATAHIFRFLLDDCSDPATENDFPISIYVAFISGLWYIMAAQDQIGAGRAIFFYGTTTSLGIPAVNTIVCAQTSTFDNPLVQCIYGGTIDYAALASGGTATLS